MQTLYGSLPGWDDKPAGQFHFPSYYTHNYREFINGFNDWVEQVAESKNRTTYRTTVAPKERVAFTSCMLLFAMGNLVGTKRKEAITSLHMFPLIQ